MRDSTWWKVCLHPKSFWVFRLLLVVSLYPERESPPQRETWAGLYFLCLCAHLAVLVVVEQTVKTLVPTLTSGYAPLTFNAKHTSQWIPWYLSFKMFGKILISDFISLGEKKPQKNYLFFSPMGGKKGKKKKKSKAGKYWFSGTALLRLRNANTRIPPQLSGSRWVHLSFSIILTISGCLTMMSLAVPGRPRAFWLN